MTFKEAAYQQGVEDAIEKLAARRGMREIMQAMGAGNLDRANMLAKTRGVLKPSWQGSEIRDLGAGGEGLATLVAHPKHGVTVRKLFDPTAGVYSPEIIKRKEQLGDLPGMARLQGVMETQRGTPMHFNEYVPGTDVNAMTLGNTPGDSNAYTKSLLGLRRAGRQKGFEMMDLRGGNARLTSDGQVKFIDAMPFRNEEVMTGSIGRRFRQAHGSSQLPVTFRGLRTLNATPPPGYNTSVGSKDSGAFKRYQFTGQLPPPAPSPTVAPALPPTAATRRPTAPAAPQNNDVATVAARPPRAA